MVEYFHSTHSLFIVIYHVKDLNRTLPSDMERKLLYHAQAFQKLMNDMLSVRKHCAPEAVDTGSSDPGERYFIKS